MLHLTILCIGKTNEAYVKAGLDKYNKLLSKFCKLDWLELPDVKNGNKMDAHKLKLAEGELIQKHIPDNASLVLLDEDGKHFNSALFASWFEKLSYKNSKLVFVIGGSYGLEDTLKTKGENIALSELTFNHQMVRVILAEQLFRAFTIIKGSTYHH